MAFLDTVSGCFRHRIGKRRKTLPHTSVMRRAGLSSAFASVMLCVMLAGCGSTSTAEIPVGTPVENMVDPTSIEWPLVITSASLPAVTPVIEASSRQSPARIVTLATGAGELIAAMGAGDQVVGRDETSSAPQIKSAPIVTKAHQVSAEQVLALTPDLVIIDSATGPVEVLDQIRASGIRVEMLPDTWTVADMALRIDALGGFLGLSASNIALAQESLIPSVPDTSTVGPRVAFLYLRGPSSIYLLGGEGSGADALIEAAGGVDVGAEAGYEPFTPLTAEALIAAAPDVLLVMTEGLASVGGVDGLRALPGVAQTPAGASGRVIAVDDTVLLSFGARTGALIENLRTGLAR